jgi:hypothetical protein
MNARCFLARLALCLITSLLFVTSLSAQNIAASRRNPLQIALLAWYEINQTTSFYAGNCGDNRVWGGIISDGLAFDGENIWMSTVTDPCGTGGTYKVRASDGFVVPCGPPSFVSIGHLAYDGANMWITNGGLFVNKVRGSDCTILGSFMVGDETTAVAFDGARAVP